MPLQWGRTQLSAEGEAVAVTVVLLFRPSTGPRSGERGRSPYVFCTSTLPTSLQWGRAQLSAEGDVDQPGLLVRAYASTGPRSTERGRVVSALETRSPI